MPVIGIGGPDQRLRRRPGRTRSALAVLALLAAMVGVVGCGVVSSMIDTEQALQAAGYQSVSVHFSFLSSGDRVDVHVSVAAPATKSDVRDVASVVWQHLHQRFDVLRVSVRGTGTGAGTVTSGAYSFADLQAAFGPRNPSWNQTSLSQSAEHLGLAILGGIVLVVVLVAVVAVIMTRRNRRRRPPWGGGAPQWGGGAPPWVAGSPPWTGGAPPWGGGSPPWAGGPPTWGGGGGGGGAPLWPPPPGPPPPGPPPGPAPGPGWSPGPSPAPGLGWSPEHQPAPGQPPPPAPQGDQPPADAGSDEAGGWGPPHSPD